jgi:hypothetical protein
MGCPQVSASQNVVLNALLRKREEFVERRSQIDVEIASLDRRIFEYQAMERARALGIRLIPKFLDKAIAWGKIALLLERNGPLSTGELKVLFGDNMDDGRYNTLRSHLFRMDMEKIIVRDINRRWTLIKKD